MPRIDTPVSVIGLSLAAYALGVVFNGLFVSPAYTPATLYHAAFPIVGYLIGRRLDDGIRQRFIGAVLAAGIAMAAWGLYQTGVQGAGRAAAYFETPATLAATLNLALFPALALLIWGRPGAGLVMVVAILVAGIVAAFSRGAFIGTLAGLLYMLASARRAGLVASPGAPLRAYAAVGAGAIAGLLIPGIVGLISSDNTIGTFAAAEAARHISPASGISRLELWAIAWKALPDAPWIGSGYLGYTYLLESMRGDVPSYAKDAITYFTHNDYLQSAYELGLPGLVAIGAVVLSPALLAWRAVPMLVRDRQECVVLIGFSASLVTMMLHAFVDFPFYIPICLLLFGICAGGVERIVGGTPAGAAGTAGRVLRIGRATGARLATTVGGVFVLWLFIVPVAAEAASEFAHSLWRNGKSQRAAYWFTVARRFEPRDWRYHYYEGHFWAAQAASNRMPEAVRRADEAFAAGMKANPREVRNVLGRMEVQRAFSALLERPMSFDAQRALAEQARRMAPLNLSVRIGHVLTLVHVDARYDLQTALAALLRDWPDNPRIVALVHRLEGRLHAS